MTPPLPHASPSSLGFDAARLARIDRFLAERYVEPGRLPCAQLVVARHGKVVHETVLGHASLERKHPLAADTIFRIYSMTKPVTSVAFMMLVEEGRIALDDPVAKWIPSWRDLAVYRSGQPGAFATQPVDAPIRVIDLLRHTSGLTYGFQNRSNVDAAYRSLRLDPFEAESLASLVDGLARVPLEFSPGTSWNYGVSTDVVGHLVSLVSGLPFDEVVRTRILQPLGMVDTVFPCRPTRLRASPTVTRVRPPARSCLRRRSAGRPGRRRVRCFHDATDPVEHLPDPARAADDGERSDRGAGMTPRATRRPCHRAMSSDR